jgi:hypothetical protein
MRTTRVSHHEMKSGTKDKAGAKDMKSGTKAGATKPKK